MLYDMSVRSSNELKPNSELRDFLIVLRRALLMICKYIETRYTTEAER